MQQFCLREGTRTASRTCRSSGFTAVDLGYQQGNAVSNMVTRIDDAARTQVYLQLFDQIWNDEEQGQRRHCGHVCEHIAVASIRRTHRSGSTS